MSTRIAVRISAFFGFGAVALGAFGAHGLKDLLEANGRTDVWKTAVLYHLVHAVAMLALSFTAGGRSEDEAAPRWRAGRGAWWMFLAGVLIFSGSLYTLALTNIGWLGAITPIGGVALLGGWLTLALKPPV